MTVSSTVNRNDYVGNGATTVYPYTFQIFNQSHLKVWTQSVAGVVTKLTITTDYTVSDVGLSGGGNVTLNSALASNYLLAIKLVLPITQLTDLKNQGRFFPEVHERVFDRGIRIDQQLYDLLSRSIKVPDLETSIANLPAASVRANKLLGFDVNGAPLMYDLVDFYSNIQILGWAYVQAFAITSATRNANDVITTASIVWPDGATGTFTTDTINATYNAIDAWHATHILSGTTKTVTQTAVTRNASGAVTAQPAITLV